MSTNPPKKRWRTSRIVQLVGMVVCIVGFPMVGTGYGGGLVLLGFLLIVGGRAYEWVRRE